MLSTIYGPVGAAIANVHFWVAQTITPEYLHGVYDGLISSVLSIGQFLS